MIRYKIFFDGLVQGVGFRYFVLRSAEQLNITGFVKNLPDGRVEVESQGSEIQLAEFLAFVRQGSRYSEITKLTVENIETQPNESKFTVKY